MNVSQSSAQSSVRQQQHPLIQQLADIIEHTWQTSLELSPYAIPADLGYIENQLEGETLIIENECYQTPQFRKLHLELAKVGNGLDILHCVMFPNPAYPLPLFGCDIVGARGQISAAIVDLSPVQADRSLPATYHFALSQLPQMAFSQPRDLPAWGDIFSQFCTFVRPVDATENQQFLDRVQQVLQIHCNMARETPPVDDPQERTNILMGQANYCHRQQENDKTRRVLEKSFGSEWTDRYMKTMLFDAVAVS
ncbi:phycocyanobilin:ferredoxin oxidoreductase [filamentous cyanobacterium LEGE 11480]|uniref:Phycocyanobilin:ferredoxin oxidoreductase n=2 Tax=Romeriopsis TaxID=2992131 RepID=A0A928VNN0_9CYAN|nr:phycocyanobilin:ferredoxin oxidoreductase [Romeriopsis navalis LEGE 11480]